MLNPKDVVETETTENSIPQEKTSHSLSNTHELDPGNDGLLVWVGEILLARAARFSDYLASHPESSSIPPHDLDASILKRLQFYVNATFRGHHPLEYLRTCPIQVVTHVCLLALELSRNNCLEEGLNLVSDLQRVIKLFQLDIAEFHDAYSLDLFLSFTHQALRIAFSENDSSPVLTSTANTDLRPDWHKISQVTLLACKLCTYLIYRESTSKLKSLTEKISKLPTNPEVYYLLYEVKRKKRQENHSFVAPPTKKEFALVRKGLSMMPSNALLRLAGMRLLFDAARSPHRAPNLSIYRIPLRNPEIITSLLHEELQIALKEPLPLLIAADALTLATEFYAYRNLRNIMCRAICTMNEGTDGLEVGYFDVDDDGWALEAFDLPDMINTYKQKAEIINPYSAQLSIVATHRWLDQCKLSEAIEALKSGLEFDPLDADLVQQYIRLLIGGNASLRSVALITVDKAILVAQVNSWSPCRVAHLYFLKAMVELLNDDLDKTINTWVEGFKRYPREFLAQFAFWTKRQCKKYLWPSTFTDLKIISKLRTKLSEYSNVITLSEDADTSSDHLVYATLLEELNILFPIASEVEEKVSKLREQWDYLMEPLEAESDGGESEISEMDDSTIDEEVQVPLSQIPVVMRPENSDPNVWFF